MVRTVSAAVLVLMVLAIAVPLAFADNPAPQEKGTNVPPKSDSFLGLALGFGMAIAAFGGAIGQSKAISAAVESMSRQPEVAGKIQTAMIIGLALIETLVIYMLLICFVLGAKVGG